MKHLYISYIPIKEWDNNENWGRYIYQQLPQRPSKIFLGLQDVLRTSLRHVLKTPPTLLQRNNFSSSKTSWRHLEDVFKTSWKTKNCYVKDVFRRSWRHVLNMSIKTCLENVLKTCLQGVLETNKMLTGDICIYKI